MVKLRRQSTLPGRSGCDLATVRQVFVFVFGFFGFLQRNDIWSISWYDINSTHEHVVLLFIEFSDILKALTLKQIIMITRFMAASQRKHTNNQLRYRYRRPQKETTPPNGEREQRTYLIWMKCLAIPTWSLLCTDLLVSMSHAVESYLPLSVACPSFLQFDG